MEAKQVETAVPSTLTEVAAVDPVSAAPISTSKNGIAPASASSYEPLYKSEIGGRAASASSTIDDTSASASESETSPAVAAPTKVALDKHRALVRAGMDAFRTCNVVLSLKHFDEAIAAAPSRKPFMWYVLCADNMWAMMWPMLGKYVVCWCPFRLCIILCLQAARTFALLPWAV